MKLRTQMNVKTQSNKRIENWKKKVKPENNEISYLHGVCEDEMEGLKGKCNLFKYSF